MFFDKKFPLWWKSEFVWVWDVFWPPCPCSSAIMMQCLKKMYRDELLHLALLLSLLRVDPDSYLGLHVHPVRVGLTGPYNTTWTHLPSTRATFVHPKNLDSILLNYERDVFADLNSLGRYNRPNHQQFETYLLNIEEASTGGVEDAVIPGSSSANVERRPADENVVPGPSYLPDGLTDDIPLPGELTQEVKSIVHQRCSLACLPSPLCGMSSKH